MKFLESRLAKWRAIVLFPCRVQHNWPNQITDHLSIVVPLRLDNQENVQ